ncbi:MAG: sigma-70 family RNA polymerase sigma factor [Saprospiraceae bacterium]|nr:sigma-70 family RNA polymerase sigma factor [Saprospiraceae bacterium]
MEKKSDSYDLTHLFRHSYGKVLAVLIKRFGPAHLEDIEDAIQEALIKAMRIWPYQDIPVQPFAWLLKVAHNQLIDQLRKKQKTVLSGEIFENNLVNDLINDPTLENTIDDDQLKMIFTCCHPSLSEESQIILTLKLIAGFSNGEVANALLKKEDTVAKAFTRAKRKLQDENIRFDHAFEIGLRSRLNIVLRIIYLIFTEGYKPYEGNSSIKKDLCYEAIRLALLLDNNKFCQTASTKALIALMCFHTARFEARQGPGGELIDLEHQDRSIWNQELINIGIRYLNAATDKSDYPLDYILQAFISYYHCSAERFVDTDWKSILRLYDIHLTKQYSPVIALNRIVAFSKVHGIAPAYQLLLAYEQNDDAPKQMLFHAIKGELLSKLGRNHEAAEAFQKAVVLGENAPEINHLKHKISSLIYRDRNHS